MEILQVNTALVLPEGKSVLAGRPKRYYASDEDIRQTLDAKWSANTRRTYRAQWQMFVGWCGEHNFTPLPAMPETVARYVISISVEGKRIPTLRLAVASIAAVHQGTGHENPCKDIRVKDAVSGRNRLDKRVAKQKKPLDDSVIDDVIKNLWTPRGKNWGRKETPTEAGNRAKIDEALIRLIQCCALRRSEASELQWQDFELESDGSGRLTIRSSKTDQTSLGYMAYVSRRATRALMAIRPDNPVGNMFGMSPNTVNNRVKAAIYAAGYDPSEYGGHSGRVGFAVMLTQKQAPTSEVMRMGRWRSSTMVARYTRGIEAAASARWLE